MAETLKRFFQTGATMGSVNIAQVSLSNPSPAAGKTLRILNFHQNVPGVLKVSSQVFSISIQQINKVLSEFNIEKQTLESGAHDVSVLVADICIDDVFDQNTLMTGLKNVKESIGTRIISL